MLCKVPFTLQVEREQILKLSLWIRQVSLSLFYIVTTTVVTAAAFIGSFVSICGIKSRKWRIPA